MESTYEWLDNLKLKASIGSQGNDNIGNFRYTNTYTIENANGKVSTVFNAKGSENITWEIKFCRSLSDGADCHRHLMRKMQAGAKNMQS